MALINCQECNKEFSDKASACPNCACPVSAIPPHIITSVEKQSEKIGLFVEINGEEVDLFDIVLTIVKPGSKKIGFLETGAIIMEFQKLAGKKEGQALWQKHNLKLAKMYNDYVNASVKSDSNSAVKCPKCGSENLSIDKQGFGVGKAVIGGLLMGGIGIAAGGIGAKKIRITCLKCGNQFMSGKGG